MHPDVIKLLETGFAAQQRDNLVAAETRYREVLERDADNEFALNLLGVVLVRQERFDEAVAVLEKAIDANAGDPETHNNLGLARKGLHQFAAAESAFRQSLSIDPKQPQAMNNLGNVLGAVDRHTEAVECFEAAVQLEPRFADCYHNLAVSLNELARPDAALTAILKAVSLDHGRSQFQNTEGEILLREARYEDARARFLASIDIDGNTPARINLSTVEKQLGNVEGARSMLADVIAREPDNAEAHHHLGVLLEQLGDTSAAAEAHRQALKHDPRHASSYYQVAKLRDERLTAPEIDAVKALIEDEAMLDIFRSSLYFALACESEKDKDYSSSIEYFSKAQAIKARRHPYNARLVKAYYDVSRDTFPVAAESPDVCHPTPVFVIGMPRSGTTLTEQILTSHSQVGGAGEVGFIKELASDASSATGKTFPACAAAMGAPLCAKLRERYLDRMTERCGDSPFVVDKNPLNFNFTGFIATLFPEARILYCKRQPMDNCVSIFRLPFDDNQGYSHDLAALGHYYREHERLMDFWLECYPDQILTVHYEETVDDLESQVRRLLEFVGLGFEESVLRFYENRRAVLTPSAEQVRQPIYKSSVNAWRRYGAALDPLVEALEEAKT